MERKLVFRRVLSEILFRSFLLWACGYLISITLGGAFHTDLIGDTFGCTSDPCIIKANSGGNLLRFQYSAEALARGERNQAIIDGPCASGCAVFADEGRASVCTTRRATLGVHKGYVTLPILSVVLGRSPREIWRRFDQPLSDEFKALVQARGGLPENGDVLWFSAEEVKHFIPLCQDTNREAKGDRLARLTDKVPLPRRNPHWDATATARSLDSWLLDTPPFMSAYRAAKPK